MRTIIFGSRGITDYDVLLRAVKASGIDVTSVVSGGAKGADALGERYAREHDLPLHMMPAAWDENVPPGRSYNPMAGYERNEDMAVFAAQAPEGGAAIGLWDGTSRGTRDMKRRANTHGLRVCVSIVRPTPMPKTCKIVVRRRTR
jgi:hypothetical protein